MATTMNPAPAHQPLLALTAAQTGQRLGVGARTIERMAEAGQFPAPVRVGRLTRWPVASIEAFLSGRWEPRKEGA